MRIVFMGTPAFAVPSLRALDEAFEVVLVVTRPDAVRGRGRTLVPSPVKDAACAASLPVVEARRVDAELIEHIASVAPDAICVAAYGAILPDELLRLAPLGCVNVHGSLLPCWRGAAPIQRAILGGDERAGVSIMAMASELDAGAYCRQASVEVADKDCASVMAELAEVGASELVAALRDIEAGTVVWTEQDPALVTYAKKVTKEEMELDPSETALTCVRKVRASGESAPARTYVAGRGVRVLEARLCEEDVAPAAVMLAKRGRVLLGCAEGALELLRVKPDGKREMEARAWAQGLRGTDLSWGKPR